MSPSSRTGRTLLAALLACGAVPQVGRAQAPVAAPARRQAGGKANRGADARVARARREVREAVAALAEAAEIARGFEDLYESIRTQAEAAEALWPHDEQGARAVLRRAWEAANAPGAESRVQGLGTSGDEREDALEALAGARRFVIKAALKHDPRLGETLMREFERDLAGRAAGAAQGEPPQDGASHADPSDPAADEGTAPRRRRRTLSAAGQQRLTVALQLLDGGDSRAAAEAAAPVVAEGATRELLTFILTLRARHPAGADALYLRLLSWARSDLRADANDVLLLSTPVVSPGSIVYVNADGSADFFHLVHRSAVERDAAASLPAASRLAFFDAAASVLLRPRRSGARPGDEATALYYAVGRLLPFFEREVAQLAPALHARLAALSAEVDAARREALNAHMGLSSLAPKNPVDPLAFTLAGVAKERDPAGRDHVRLTAVTYAAEREMWERARSLTEEMEGAEARRGARLAVAVQQVAGAGRAFEDEEAGAERAAAFVRAADVPPEARALGLARAAELAAKRGSGARAAELLAEAAGHAEGSARRGRNRAAVYALLVLSAARAGGARAWELLPAFVRAADEADELRFGRMRLAFNVGASDTEVWTFAPREPTSLAEVFAAAARLDAARALVEARSFADEEMRAEALLHAARAALEKNARRAGTHAR